MYYPGFDIKPDIATMNFEYGAGMFGPITEKRKLNDIRLSLSDPNAVGPEIVYSVAMDVGKQKDLEDLRKRNLLYGAMIYARGKIGNEPVRSQGHVHAISLSCNSSTPEVYEIWSGKAIIFMQESDSDNAGECYAVHAKEGEVVIVPDGWVHCTVNADKDQEMTFGAWCVRDYGFDYVGVRKHGGVAYFPQYGGDELNWIKNPAYKQSNLHVICAPNYSRLGIEKGIPIYRQYEENHNLFNFVVNPAVYKEIRKIYLHLEW